MIMKKIEDYNVDDPNDIWVSDESEESALEMVQKEYPEVVSMNFDETIYYSSLGKVHVATLQDGKLYSFTLTDEDEKLVSDEIFEIVDREFRSIYDRIEVLDTFSAYIQSKRKYHKNQRSSVSRSREKLMYVRDNLKQAITLLSDSQWIKLDYNLDVRQE